MHPASIASFRVASSSTSPARARRFERVLALYDPETHRVMATVAAFDMRAVAHANLSWDFLLLGFPQRATTQIEQALAWGRRSKPSPHDALHADGLGSFLSVPT